MAVEIETEGNAHLLQSGLRAGPESWACSIASIPEVHRIGRRAGQRSARPCARASLISILRSTSARVGTRSPSGPRAARARR